MVNVTNHAEEFKRISSCFLDVQKDLQMFFNRTDLIKNNAEQLAYGVAVTDVDGDGQLEFFVAGFNERNRILKWTGTDYTDMATDFLADEHRHAIGVGACDIDGDGREEIYVLNTDTFGGEKRFADRLFAFGLDGWIDLFSLPENRDALNLTAGRSVVAVDRFGRGQYGVFVANYGGAMRLYEINDDGQIRDIAPQVGIAMVTNGRSALSFPIVSESNDIFVGNENGQNFLFRNQGDGTFTEIAQQVGLDDPFEHARGIAPLDTHNGRFGLVLGNWEGPHRLFVQSTDGLWDDIAPRNMALPSRVRTVIVADFDNDGYEEVFFNNIGEANRLFGLRDGEWKLISIGDALEPLGLGTGGAVADLDGDGRLELLLAHGESVPQLLTLYHTPDNGNHYLRVFPKTKYGAPARGALVTLYAPERTQRRVIDAGSGYLCQMEPVAHFGLGKTTTVNKVEVRYLDGTVVSVDAPAIDGLLVVEYPR